MCASTPAGTSPLSVRVGSERAAVSPQFTDPPVHEEGYPDTLTCCRTQRHPSGGTDRTENLASSLLDIQVRALEGDFPSRHVSQPESLFESAVMSEKST